MPEIFTLPRVQVFDSNGNPLAGAKLYAYQAGTSTPQNTYSDSALSVANANPVVADANGVFGAIFMLPADYKFILQTAAGVTVWTADNVPGGPGTTFSLSDSGAAIGPLLSLDRTSGSPAANDVIGGIRMRGNDSGGGTDTYAQIQAEIVDPSASSEDGRLTFRTAVAGTLGTRMRIEQNVILDTSLFFGTRLAGVWELISATDPTVSAASIDITSGIDSTYDTYELEFELKPETDDAQLRLKTGLASGGLHASGYQYANRIIKSDEAEYDTYSSLDGTPGYFALTDDNTGYKVGNASVEGVAGRVTFWSPDLNGSKHTYFLIDTVYANPSSLMIGAIGRGMYSANIGFGFNRLNLAFNTGNIAAGGFVKLWGRRRA